MPNRLKKVLENWKPFYGFYYIARGKLIASGSIY